MCVQTQRHHPAEHRAACASHTSRSKHAKFPQKKISSVKLLHQKNEILFLPDN